LTSIDYSSIVPPRSPNVNHPDLELIIAHQYIDRHKKHRVLLVHLVEPTQDPEMITLTATSGGEVIARKNQ
jgi:hypothetical protein